MAIHMDLTETANPDKVGEFERVAAGPVHLLVMEVKENGGKNGEHVVKFEVLAHPDKSQIGLTHTEYYPADAKMAWKLLEFCYAAKIADREEMARHKAAGNSYPTIELTDAEGRQLFATIKVTEKTNATTGNVQHFHNLASALSIDDPKAANHPRNTGMLAKATGQAPRPVTGGQQQAAPTKAAASADPFASVT